MKYQTFIRTTNLIKARLSKIHSYLLTVTPTDENPLDNVEHQKLLVYQAEVKLKQAEFDRHLRKLIDSSEVPSDYDEGAVIDRQDEINELCVTLESKIKALLLKLEDDAHSVSTNSIEQVPTQHSVVRLPKIELKHFSGDPQTWISFINLFDTTIHSNTTLSPVAKFQYLLGTLSGEALNLVKSLPISEANYTIAYETLRERYHSVRRLTSLHLNKIIDLPQVSFTPLKNLRSFLNVFNENAQALSALDCNITRNNPLLSTMLLRKIDHTLRNKYESTRTEPQGLPQVTDIIKFLSDECAHAEDASLHSSEHRFNKFSSHSQPLSKPNYVKSSTRPVTLVTMTSEPQFQASTNEFPCFACSNVGHRIYSCPLFKGKSNQERYNIVKSHHRCFCCLGKHEIKHCKSKHTCLKCNGKHHTLLHLNTSSNDVDLNSQMPKFVHNSTEQSNRAGCSTETIQKSIKDHNSKEQSNFVGVSTEFSPRHQTSTVLLATVLVKLITTSGNTHVFRALIDSCSQCNFISEHAAQLLGVQRHKSVLHVTGIAQSNTCSNGLCYLDLETLGGKPISRNNPMLILDKITSHLPKAYLSPDILEKVKSFTLADPTFHLPGPIDVLLGGALFPYIFTGENHSLGQGLPFVMNTQFGYTIVGQAPCADFISNSDTTHLTTLLTVSDFDLHSLMQRFWRQEEPPSSSTLSTEDIQCENHYSTTHSRDLTGRYCVRLPFKPDHDQLGTSYNTAKHRFSSLENKFIAQPQFKDAYVDFMNEYLDSGHMTVCDTIPANHYFLPHHGVLKETSSTTKLRTVFDASSKTSTGVCLNDILLTGPKLQLNVFDVLFNFRRHNVVFTSDIRQMYRQIKVHPDDQCYQLILWRSIPSSPLQPYQLTTVTYGMNCSPFLAQRTLRQLADDEKEYFPEAALVLKNNTYVDDVISGHETEEQALILQTELIQLLKKGGFELRKWTSTSKRLLGSFPKEHLEVPKFLQNCNEPYFSILGLNWSSPIDSFSYSFNLPSPSTNTKRCVLSVIAKISYDPCGFLSPVTMWAKLFMQMLWTKGYDWDEPLPVDIVEMWTSFMSQMGSISKIEIPRSLKITKSSTIQIHGFSDASERGYGAVVYLRCSDENDCIHITQLISKTRVAPLKRVSLPRLELCGSHLLGKLISYCQSLITPHYSIEKTYAWCDSTIVLSWLQIPSYRLKTYVANRVSEIQGMVPPHCWSHINSQENPADCASRGLLPSELHNHPLWWKGPSWLIDSPLSWPQQNISLIRASSLEDVKPDQLTVLVATQHELLDTFSKYSKWTTLLRTFSYVLRFIKNLRTHMKIKTHLTVNELQSATNAIFKLVQQACFDKDIDLLKANRPCSVRLQRLSPFLDEENLIRVGGRLRNSALEFNVKHPVILPKTHFIVNLLVDHYHIKHLHAPPQLLQSLLAQDVWILSARSLIRSRIHQCIRCFRSKPTSKCPLMGDLPASRISQSRPFMTTGVDFCGPFTAKAHTLRSLRQFKLYICIFVCFATKAVHLETVSDLSSDAFIAALSRFVSRRGVCKTIHCDNGTNFVGANSKLKAVFNTLLSSKEDEQKVINFSTNNSIEFKFNPPSAPHQGGIWEAAVKSMKYHLHRVIGNTILTIEEYNTITAKIEAILNSRPLTSLSADPTDFTPLTPGHFLVGGPLTAVPEVNVEEVPLNRLKRWQLLQAFTQQIWRRWSKDYLHTLQQKTKWTTPRENLKINDLVIVQDGNASPLSWPLARVVAVYPGTDNVVRVVKLQSQHGLFTRPVVKLFPLPVPKDSN